MKKMQIFVSSTYEDLKDERQKMVEAILDAGHIPAGMEIFGGAGTVIEGSGDFVSWTFPFYVE